MCNALRSVWRSVMGCGRNLQMLWSDVRPQIAEESPKCARNIGTSLHGVTWKKMAVFSDTAVISWSNAVYCSDCFLNSYFAFQKFTCLRERERQWQLHITLLWVRRKIKIYQSVNSQGVLQCQERFCTDCEYLTDLEGNKMYLPTEKEAQWKCLSLNLSQHLPRGTEINHADVTK